MTKRTEEECRMSSYFLFFAFALARNFFLTFLFKLLLLFQP